MVDDLSSGDHHAGHLSGVEPRGSDIVGHVDDEAAAAAHQVVVSRSNVGVVTLGAAIERQLVEFAQFDELLEGAVHGGPGNLGKQCRGCVVDLIGAEVHIVAFEHLSDDAPLGRKTVAARFQSFEQGGGHGRQRYARSTFEKWAKNEGLIHDDATTGEAVLFQTCYVQHNEPEIGRDTIDVLRANSVDITCEAGLNCCGMPAWESGDLDTMRSKAKANLDKLEPHVDAGKKVLAINPTCSMMLRQEYPTLVDDADRERAQKVADQVMDPAEFLWSIRREERFNEDFKSTPGDTVSYHAPCHLRAQAVGFKGRDLIRKIPGVTPTTTMECCGHDGTYAMKTEGYEVSIRIGKKAFDGMNAAADAEVWATDCPLAATQFGQHAGRRPMHPMSILARAYRPDGFPTPIPPATEG